MKGCWDRPVQRATRLVAGLILFGVSLALLVRAGLGLDPWDVFNQGVSQHTGLSLGQVTVIGSVVLVLAFVPLRQRVGVGTVANAAVVGPVLDLSVAVVPAPDGLILRATFLVLSILGVAVGTGLYVGAGWGPGPRDGVMTGLAALGVPVFVARASIEGTVLVLGWLLGGKVGLATVVFAVTIGPLVQAALRRLRIRPRPLAGRATMDRPVI